MTWLDLTFIKMQPHFYIKMFTNILKLAFILITMLVYSNFIIIENKMSINKIVIICLYTFSISVEALNK